MLSVVVPAYNEGKMIAKTARMIHAVLVETAIFHEIVFVDDGSRDETWREIERVSREMAVVRGVHFSRNFGKEAAIFAGLEAARGDCCAVMDCDLQHPPQKLPEMYAYWQEGYQVINGVKADRGKESAAYGFAARAFYKVMSRAAKIGMSRSSDFKLMDRQVVDTLLALKERKTFFRALVGWVGYRSIDVPFYVEERVEGTSHFSTGSLVRYAVSNISSFSAAPMQLVTVIGCVFLLMAVLLGVQTLFHWFNGTAADGFTTVIMLILLVGSIQMISLGIIGYYIAQIYMEGKARPRYLVDAVCGDEKGTTM